MIVNDHVPVTFGQIVKNWPKKNESDSNVSAMVEYLLQENRIAAMVSLNSWWCPSDQIINEKEVVLSTGSKNPIEPKGMVHLLQLLAHSDGYFMLSLSRTFSQAFMFGMDIRYNVSGCNGKGGAKKEPGF